MLRKKILFMVDNAYSCIDVVYPEIKKLSYAYEIDIIFTCGSGRNFAKSILEKGVLNGFFRKILIIDKGNKLSVLNFFRTIRKINTLIKNPSNEYDMLIIGSMISFEEKLVLNTILTKNTKIIGLVTSMPVMLIRSPKKLSNLLKDSMLLRCVLDNITRVGGVENTAHSSLVKKIIFFYSLFKSHILKNGLKNLITKSKLAIILLYSGAYQRWFFSQSIYSDKLSKLTGYLPIGVVNVHLVANKYWEYCIQELYLGEATLSYKNISCIYDEKEAAIKNVSEYSLLILGPTDINDKDIILRDIESLDKSLQITRIEVRAHPRFKQVSVDFIAEIVKLQKNVSIVMTPEKESLSDSMSRNNVIFGYYSSVFELILPDSDKLMIVSLEWNKHRYKKVEIELISGACCGFSEDFSFLNSAGELYCTIRPNRKSTQGDKLLSECLKTISI
jgi:hypothetical protein